MSPQAAADRVRDGEVRAELDPSVMYNASDGRENTAPVESFPEGASPFRCPQYGRERMGVTAERVIRGGGWSDSDPQPFVPRSDSTMKRRTESPTRDP
jgi:hypothetical protein